jgi:hypothetical protein
MQIRKHFTKWTQTYTIDLREFNMGEITVSRQENDTMMIGDENWLAPEINWCGCGGQSIQNANRFYKAMKIAEILAWLLVDNREFTKEHVHFIARETGINVMIN